MGAGVLPHDPPEVRRRKLDAHAARVREYVARNHDRVNADRRRRAKVIQPWTRPSAKTAKFAFGANRRAVRQGITERLTATEVRTVVGPCVYCGDATTSWDHVIPLCLGGRNAIANLVPCCLPCNRRKNHRTPEQAGMTLRRAA